MWWWGRGSLGPMDMMTSTQAKATNLGFVSPYTEAYKNKIK